MSKRFALGITTIEDVTFLKVSGVLDEDNHLERSVAKIEGSTVEVDVWVPDVRAEIHIVWLHGIEYEFYEFKFINQRIKKFIKIVNSELILLIPKTIH